MARDEEQRRQNQQREDQIDEPHSPPLLHCALVRRRGA